MHAPSTTFFNIKKVVDLTSKAPKKLLDKGIEKQCIHYGADFYYPIT